MTYEKALTAWVTGALLVACSVTDIGGTDGVGAPARDAGTTTQGGPACGAPGDKSLAPADPEAYPKCACEKGGAARCVPVAGMPQALRDQLSTCQEGGGACVPDDLVKSGGVPATCQSSFGEGRCMSVCLPQVADNADLLDRGKGNACDAGQRCVPCTDPTKGTPTGVCDLGKAAKEACEADGGVTAAPSAPLACPYVGPPLVDVSKLPSCGDGARCVDAKLVPANVAPQLAKCETGLCAPEKTIAAGGMFLPKTCRSVRNAEGRCSSVSLPAVAAQKDILPVDGCDASERCVPCFAPGDGKPTGACATVPCDAPKEPAVAFPECCKKGTTNRGKCVPGATIPASMKERLDDRDCKEPGDLCVPSALVSVGFVPPKCTASGAILGNYKGVCLSDCLDFGFFGGIAINQGTCPEFERCAPCERNGQPTGLPGCEVSK